MTIPTLTAAPLVVPNKFGGDPVAFSAAMQAWIAWENTRAAQDPALLAWIDGHATDIADAAAAVAAQSPVANAQAAAESAAAALAQLNDFKGRYYGALTASPALDPLGNACDVGDVYFNTVDQVMMTFNSLGQWQNYEATAAGHAAGAADSAAQASGAAVTATGAVSTVSAAVVLASAAVATAQIAAAAAAASATLFDSTALGLAGTVSGNYFSVPAATDDLMIGLYRNDAGSATLIANSYAATKVDALELTQTVNCIAAASAAVATQAAVVPLIANL